MTPVLVVALPLLAVLLVYLMIAVRTWLRVRATRLVICPETQLPAAVNVDVGHAIVSALRERMDVRLTSCERWSERGLCAQPCASQIESASNETRPATIATRFFANQRCAICQRPIEAPSRMTLEPGFVNPATGRIDAWDTLPPRDLPRAIATWPPLCANCTLAEMFRQESPDRVTDRTGMKV
jgi:hypothetical protein